MISLVVVVAASVGAVLIADAARRLLVPIVVIEILVGVVIGPSVLDLVHVTALLSAAAQLGVCLLFFLAAYEIDLRHVRGARPGMIGAGWLLSLGLGMVVAGALATAGVVEGAVAVGLALTTTALGVLLPVLRDSGVLDSSLGPLMLGFGAVGEFGPIVLLALLFGPGSPVQALASLAIFAAVVVTLAIAGRRVRPPRHLMLARASLLTSGQLVVRGSILVLLALVLLASRLDLDVLLGAFCAGALVRALDPAGDATLVRVRLDAVGFGFLIPLFFITTGMRFDLHVFSRGPLAAVLVLVFTAAFLVVRGVPVLLYRRFLRSTDAKALALFSATALPLVIVITTTATRSGAMDPATASALVGAGMVSVVAFPALACRVLRAAPSARPTGSPSDFVAVHPPMAGVRDD
jgi:Kef-type K+ transport system membrane component KefB